MSRGPRFGTDKKRTDVLTDEQQERVRKIIGAMWREHGTQAAAGALFGESGNRVSSLLLGESRVSTDLAKRVAKAVGKPLEEVLG
jgi:hypothetical protein